MTTIASDGNSMAADGLCHFNNTITTTSENKIHKLHDGSIVGTCGDTSFGQKYVAWLFNGEDKPIPDSETNFSALILQPTGTLLFVGIDLYPVRIDAPFAIGSGMDLAIGAMAAGASPEKAVQIAAKRDTRTGGRILTIHLDPKP